MRGKANEGDIAIRFDEEVGTYSVVPRTPEAGVWLEEQTHVKGTIDNLNAEGARDLARRARRAGFTVSGPF